MGDLPILSLITFLPVAGAIIVSLLPRGGHATLRLAALASSILYPYLFRPIARRMM